MNIRPFYLRRILALLICCILMPVQLFASAAAPETTQNHSQPTAEAGDMIHILLIGQDRREQETAARADSIILCSFYPGEKRITITSFLRDLYVAIPGHQNNRLNAAYAFGGMELMKQTMEQNFGVSIDGCIEADFSHFPQIIDSLGGVSIDLRQDEAQTINQTVPGDLTAGICLLSGEQALAYSRIRKLDHDGDFSRTDRQRKLIGSLLDSYRNANLLTILSAVVDLLPMITTTFTKKQIIVLASKLFPLLDSPKIISQHIPADGTYAYETIRDMNVLTADMDAIRTQLNKSLLPPNENVS